jgi:DNA helicase-2/ATP-dependent DNA helicase PcrA
LHEIVVICPANDRCQTAADALREAGIAAFVRGTEYRQVQSTMFVEACAAWATLGREVSGYRLGELLRRWRRLLGSSWTREKDLALTELLLSHSGNGSELAVTLLRALLDVGLRSSVEKSSRSDESLELAQMEEALTTGALGDLSISGLAERARKVDRVEVTTMTSSKGLEFDIVVILGLDEKVVPDFRSIDDPLKLAEDRRKFYVSVTRARQEVCIFYSGFVQWKSGRRAYAGPSRFLREIRLV